MSELSNYEKVQEIFRVDLEMNAYDHDFISKMHDLLEDSADLTENQETYLEELYNKI
jgi:hypothetical protein